MHGPAERQSLSSVLRERTHGQHAEAERSGFVADMLRGRASISGYALYLRNLEPAYEQLELGLDRHRQTPAIAELARVEIYRASALTADLVSLRGEDWYADLPMLQSGKLYADCIARAAEGDGEGLIGHAYVRYFGDLNGGQTLKRLLSRSLDLPARNLSFYEFPAIGDLGAFKQAYREALDRCAEHIADWEGVIAEAQMAFSLNIEVSEAVRIATLNPSPVA